MKFKTLKEFPNYRIYKSGSIAGTRGILKHEITNRGYARVTLCANGKTKRFSVHRLIAITFVTGNTSLMVNHKDGNKLNNASYNLEWCTSKENVAHCIKNGLQKLTGSFNPCSKLNEKQVAEIKKLKGTFTQRELGLRYGVSKTLIQYIHNGRNWTHV